MEEEKDIASVGFHVLMAGLAKNNSKKTTTKLKKALSFVFETLNVFFNAANKSV